MSVRYFHDLTVKRGVLMSLMLKPQLSKLELAAHIVPVQALKDSVKGAKKSSPSFFDRCTHTKDCTGAHNSLLKLLLLSNGMYRMVELV